MDDAITPTTWRLPEGHESVAAFGSEIEAVAHGQKLVRDGTDGYFYVTNRRGAYEVIRHPGPILAARQPSGEPR